MIKYINVELGLPSIMLRPPLRFHADKWLYFGTLPPSSPALTTQKGYFTCENTISSWHCTEKKKSCSEETFLIFILAA